MKLLLFFLVLTLSSCQPSKPDLGPPLSPEAEAGKQVFLELARPSCGRCHTLRHAGVEGQRAADLDEVQPSRAKILRVVERGIGVMDSQAEILTPTQMDQLATYVTEVAGRGLESD